MKLHTLSFNGIVPDAQKLEQELATNLDYFNPSNFQVDQHTLSFTTDIKLRGAGLEYTVMGTRAASTVVNQDC